MEIPEGLIQLKAVFDLFRSALGSVKDASDLLPDGEEKETVGQVLKEAENAAQIAEASIAQAFGYELCKCTFPPIPMLRVGYRMPHGERNKVQYIYECPKCNQNSAGGWAFNREVE